MSKVSRPARRRRGEELSSALLTAAWGELVAVGYARLTMGSIAVRARTSEAVLYRRWPDKDHLVLAALEHHRQAHPVAVPDTGTLRGDLLAYLTAASKVLAPFLAIAVATSLAGLLAETGMTPAQVRARILGGPLLPHGRPLYQRAHERGEIDLGRLPAAVLDLPFELVRHDLLMHLAPPRPARLRAIVDTLFLPLVQLHHVR